MSTAKRWTVEILIDEGDGGTHAVARLDTSDDAHVHGHGSWHRQHEPDTENDAGAAEDAVVRRSAGTAASELAVAEALREVAAKLSVRARVDGGSGALAAARPRTA